MQTRAPESSLIDGPEVVFRAMQGALAVVCLGYAMAHDIAWASFAGVQVAMMATWLGYLVSQPVGAAWFTLSTLAAYAFIVFNPSHLLSWAASQHALGNVIASFLFASLLGRACGVGTRHAFVFRRVPRRAAAMRPGAAPGPGFRSRR